MLAVVVLTSVTTGVPGDVRAQETDRYVILASTTSPDNSGLYQWVLPHFQKETGIEVRVIAVGTGHALNIGRRGDADLVIVHDETLERRFIEAGHGIERRALMYNEYLLIGPDGDPAKTHAHASLPAAFDAIANGGAKFVSRGDDSGTHKQEVRLWDKTQHGFPKQKWYIESGNGMGATLQMAKELGAYTLSDKATWLSFGNRRGLKMLLNDNPPLKNIYSIILVNPRKHRGIRHKEARVLSDWLLSERGQKLIGTFSFKGQTLFHTPHTPVN